MQPTSLLDRSACEALLRPHVATLDTCFRSAWARWRKWADKLEGSPSDISDRTRASALYDFLVAEAVKKFIGVDHVVVRREKGFLVLRFHDRAALRFKKFRGKSLKASVNATRQTSLFDRQSLELPESSVTPMTHLVAGYLLDGLALDFERLAITCTSEGQHLWAPIEILSKSVPLSPVVPIVPTDTVSNPKARSESPSAVVRSARGKIKETRDPQ